MKTKEVAKVVVLNSVGEVLLLRRSATDTRRPGEWDFAGGGLDDGESPAEAAARELHEEAGIKREASQLKLIYTATEYYEPLNESVIRFLFMTKFSAGENEAVTLSYEHDDSVWVPVEQALRDFPHPFYSVGLRYALEHDLLA